MQVSDLKDAVETSEAKMKKLKDHCVDREQKLGKAEVALVEAEAALGKAEAVLETKAKECELLEAKVKAFDLLEAELRAELVKAFATKDEELASQAKHFQTTEERLVQESATVFADGFVEALAQAACANPGINVSDCSPFNEIIEGKIVPLEAPED